MREETVRSSRIGLEPAGLLAAFCTAGLALLAGRAAVLHDVYAFGTLLVALCVRAGQQRSAILAAICAGAGGLTAVPVRVGAYLIVYSLFCLSAGRVALGRVPTWAFALGAGAIHAVVHTLWTAALASLAVAPVDPLTPWMEGTLIALLAVLIDPLAPERPLPGGPVGARTIGRWMAAAAVVGLGLADFWIAGIAVSDVWGRWLTLTGAALAGSGAGTALGAAMTLCLALDGVRLSGGSVLLPSSGLLAGLFARRGKAAAAFGFLVGHLVTAFQASSPADVERSLISGGAAMCAFLALPPTLLGQLRRWVAARGGEAPKPRRSEPVRWPGLSRPSADGAQGAIEERLRALSELFAEMARAFESGTESGDEGQNESARIVDRVGEALCRRCGGFRRCWQEHYYDSYSGLIAFTSDAQRGERHNLPPGLAQRCFQPHKLIRVASDAARQVRTEALLARRLSEVRRIVPAQLRGLAEVVTEIAGHFQLEPSDEPGIEEGLLRALGRRRGVVAVRVMPLGRGRYEIVCDLKKRCPTPGACGTLIAPQLTALLGVPYEVFRTSCLEGATRAAPEPPPYRRQHASSVERKGAAARRGGPHHPPCRVVLRPRTAYELRCQAAGVPKDPGGISGDASACFDLRDGRSVLLLSDGMGQGAPAALESQAAVALLRRLLEVGFEAAFAISVVNAILLVRATTEQFATLDVVVIDRYSGESTFYKIGSPPSFIRRGSHVDILRARSLPAGILTRIEVAAERRHLRHDDLIVLMTDGVLDRIAGATDGGGITSEGRIAAWLRSREDPDPTVLAGQLLGDPAAPGDDDRTVVIAQLVSREHLGSLSGAPEIPEYRRAIGSPGRGGGA